MDRCQSVIERQTRYAMVGNDHVAYQAVGSGSRDLVLIPAWFSNVEAIWDVPQAARVLERLASLGRLLLFDRRGTGLSDPAPELGGPFLERSTDDLLAVLDAAGSREAVLIGCDGGGPVAMLAASAHPARVSGLVLVNTFARLGRAADYPEGVPHEVLDAWLANTTDQWTGANPGFAVVAPSVADQPEPAAQFSRFLRFAASPGVGYATREVLHAVDVREVLGLIQAPTLVIHRRGDRMVRLPHGSCLAQHIRSARLVTLAGEDHIFYYGDAGAIVSEIEEFLTGARQATTDRRLATVLFTDIVGSTQLTASVGDRRWRQLLDAHDEIVGRLVARFQGRLIKTTGDGVLASFDGPGRALHCTVALLAAVRRIGLEVRAGLHVGEVEQRGDDITGMAVVISRRICDAAGPGSIVVSRTVTDLVVGSDFAFSALGSIALKGVPGEWQLFTLDEAHLAAAGA